MLMFYRSILVASVKFTQIKLKKDYFFKITYPEGLYKIYIYIINQK